MDWLLWALISLAAAMAIWGVFIERQLFVVRHEPQKLAVLQSGAKPIRVLHISDLHVAAWQKRKLRWLAKLGSQEFDLVVNTGDNLGHKNAIAPTLKALKPALQKPGVFVNGSNDYYAPKPRNPFGYLLNPSNRTSQVRLETEKLIGGFSIAGWQNLNNLDATLTIKGSKLRFVGVDDPHEDLAKVETIAKNAAKLKANEVLIGVAHAPYLNIVNEMTDAGVKVMFAGHTHGGQVCIPGYGALVTNCDLPTSAAKGLSSWSRNGKQLWLNVCAGLGHSIFAPVRFACRPEVRIIELLAA